MRIAAFSLSALLLGSCSGLRELPVDPALVAHIRSELDSRRTDLPRVFLDPEHDHVQGIMLGVTYPDRIVLANLDGPELRRMLAHELAHWYIRDSPYDDLPYFVEEGLAEWTAASAVGEESQLRQRASRPQQIPLPRELLELRDPALVKWTAEQYRAMTWLGLIVVANLGLDRIRELAESQTPALSYLQAAGIRPRPEPAAASPSEESGTTVPQ